MTFLGDSVTVEQEKALNNTIGNATEFNQPGFDPSEQIIDYDGSWSDWNKIRPRGEDRSEWQEINLTNQFLLLL